MERIRHYWNLYWYEDHISFTRLLALRWALFGLVAFDLWSVMLHHASRYGAGAFNVAQIGILDSILPIPTPAMISAGVLATGFFALRVALGVAIRTSMVLATTGYFGIYLWSQADSYQHHYLVALLMLICCFAPEKFWRAQQDAEEDSEASRSTKMHKEPVAKGIKTHSESESAVITEAPRDHWHWAIRLIYVQMALLYFWTAVTKCDPTWLSGVTMDQLTAEPSVRSFMSGMDARFGLAAGESYRAAAWWTMLGEFFAALVFLVPRLRLIGLFIVPWFHVGVEVLGFDIELFSYYMIAIDLILLSPNALWRRLDQYRPLENITTALERLRPQSPALGWALPIIGTIGVGLCATYLPFESAPHVAAIIGLGAGVSLYQALRRSQGVTALIGNFLAVLAMLATVHVTDSAYDYYRMWGGDLKRRGQYEEAAQRYVSANELMPDRPARRTQLGKIYERLGRQEEAMVLYQESVDVVGAYISQLTRASHGDPTNPDHHFELAENQLRLASSCGALSRAQQRLGRASDDASSCRAQALSSTQDSVNAGLRLSPNDRRRGLKIRRHLQKAKRK